jgi:hypothetical protein
LKFDLFISNFVFYFKYFRTQKCFGEYIDKGWKKRRKIRKSGGWEKLQGMRREVSRTEMADEAEMLEKEVEREGGEDLQ